MKTKVPTQQNASLKVHRQTPFLTLLFILLLLVACSQPPVSPAPTPTTQPLATIQDEPPPATATSPPPTATVAAPTPTPTTLEQWQNSLAACCPHLAEAPLPLLLALWGQDAAGNQVADIAQAAALIGPQHTSAIAYEGDIWAIVVNETVPADGLYPPGTHLQPSDNAILVLTPSQPGNQISRAEVGGQMAWVELNANGQLLAYVDPASHKWVVPLHSDGDTVAFFARFDIDANGQRTEPSVWWANGGEPVAITTSPDANNSLIDFLVANPDLRLSQTDEQQVALVDSTGAIRYTLQEGLWQEIMEYAPITADLSLYLEQAQQLVQYDDIELGLENASINPELGRLEYYDQNGVLASYSAVALDAEGKITHITDETGAPLLHFAAIEQLQARSHQMPVNYNGEQVETKVQAHFDTPRLMDAGMEVDNNYLDSVYRLWEQRITGVLQTGQVVANIYNPDPNAPYYLRSEEVQRLKQEGTFHFYVNFYPKSDPLLDINPSPAYRPHVSSDAFGPKQYWGYYYDPIRNEFHATTLASDVFLDQYLEQRLPSYISGPMFVASMPNPSTIKNNGDNWINAPASYQSASEVLAPMGVPGHQKKIRATDVGQ